MLVFALLLVNMPYTLGQAYQAGSYESFSVSISCSGACPCPSASALSSGEIASQTAIAYNKDLYCKWLITSVSTISVNFSRYDTDWFDSVVLETCTTYHCAPSYQVVKLATIRGPGDTTSSFTSTTGYLQITFDSYSYRSHSGWALQWSLIDLPCLLCSAGKYKTNIGNGVCINCMENKYSGEGAANCQDCPANSASPPASKKVLDCMCNAGWSGQNEEGLCVQCAAGKYKSTTGTDACVHCVAGKYSTSGGAQTIASGLSCSAGKSTQGRDACTEETECTQCTPGKYSGENWESVCTHCPANSMSTQGSDNESDCICNAGSYENVGVNVLCTLRSVPSILLYFPQHAKPRLCSDSIELNRRHIHFCQQRLDSKEDVVDGHQVCTVHQVGHVAVGHLRGVSVFQHHFVVAQLEHNVARADALGHADVVWLVDVWNVDGHHQARNVDVQRHHCLVGGQVLRHRAHAAVKVLQG